MPTAAIGVLAVQGDVREHRRALERSGARVVTVRRAADLAGVDGVVVPGGESTTIGKLCATFGVLGPLQEAVRAGLPVYGSCAGMILLADAVVDGRPDQPLIGGLDVVVRRNAFGRQVDSFEADVPLRDVPGGPVHGVFIRAPEVTTVGPGVAVLGRVGAAGGAGRIVAVRQGRLLATSFHPELTGDARVHALFVDIVKGRA